MRDVIRESAAAYGASPRKMTVDEYYRAAEKGVFDWDEKLELIRGDVVVLSPQRNRHSSATYRIQEALRAVFPQGVLRCQMPLRLDEHNEPEPDVLVAVGPMERYDSRHPGVADTLLVVEVADTSLLKDRKLKGPLYAEFGIGEYWILDLKSNRLEVYRDPVQDKNGKWGYASTQLLKGDAAVAPLNGNGASVSVASFVPG